MKAYNGRDRRVREIQRAIKGTGSVGVMHSNRLGQGKVKRKGDKLSLWKCGFGGRPLVWGFNDFLGNRTLNGKPQRIPYGITITKEYLNQRYENRFKKVNRKETSKWLKENNGNRYLAYCYYVQTVRKVTS